MLTWGSMSKISDALPVRKNSPFVPVIFSSNLSSGVTGNVGGKIRIRKQSRKTFKNWGKNYEVPTETLQNKISNLHVSVSTNLTRTFFSGLVPHFRRPLTEID